LAGLSARSIEMSPTEQEEIIRRAQQAGVNGF
jgi:pyruvate-formate lyase